MELRYTRIAILASMLLVLVTSCKEKSYYYEVNDVPVSSNNSDKNKEKTPEQFISIAYANLYQKALSPSSLVDVTDVITSIGDKQIAYETVISKFMNDSDVKLPSNTEMRADIEKFLVDTYKRFYVRLPSEAEKSFMKNFIESNPNVTPELVYYAFATSNEYYYY